MFKKTKNQISNLQQFDTAVDTDVKIDVIDINAWDRDIKDIYLDV